MCTTAVSPAGVVTTTTLGKGPAPFSGKGGRARGAQGRPDSSAESPWESKQMSDALSQVALRIHWHRANTQAAPGLLLEDTRPWPAAPYFKGLERELRMKAQLSSAHKTKTKPVAGLKW